MITVMDDLIMAMFTIIPLLRTDSSRCAPLVILETYSEMLIFVIKSAISGFEIGILNLFRISRFGFRICERQRASTVVFFALVISVCMRYSK
jgi:hypothetical protein